MSSPRPPCTWIARSATRQSASSFQVLRVETSRRSAGVDRPPEEPGGVQPGQQLERQRAHRASSPCTCRSASRPPARARPIGRAERLALAAVGSERSRQCQARPVHMPPRRLRAQLIQSSAIRRPPPTSPTTALGRQAHVPETEDAGLAVGHHRLLHGPPLHPRGVERDQEGGQLAPAGALHPGDDLGVLVEGRAGDQVLGAGQQPAVAVAAGRGLEREGVGAGARLGDRERDAGAAGQEVGQVPFARLGAPVGRRAGSARRSRRASTAPRAGRGGTPPPARRGSRPGRAPGRRRPPANAGGRGPPRPRPAACGASGRPCRRRGARRPPGRRPCRAGRARPPRPWAARRRRRRPARAPGPPGSGPTAGTRSTARGASRRRSSQIAPVEKRDPALGAGPQAADPGAVHAPLGEGRLQRAGAVRGDRDQQAAVGLGVVEQVQQVAGDGAGAVQQRRRVVAVAGDVAGEVPGAGEVERARQQRHRAGVDPRAQAAGRRHLRQVAEQAEARHVGRAAGADGEGRLARGPVRGRHGRPGGLDHGGRRRRRAWRR